MKNYKEFILLGIDFNGLFRGQVEAILKDYYQIIWADSVSKAQEVLHQTDSVGAVVLQSYSTGDSGSEAVRTIKSSFSELPIIIYQSPVLSSQQSNSEEETASQVENASYFIQSIRRSAESYIYAQDPQQLISYAEEVFRMIGHSKPMRRVYELIRKISQSNSKAMIFGETGTGKELVARAIHFTSTRREMPFAILNCNHKSPELVESELFGHTRGSFTGAINDRPGIFEYANGGTLFLDEIGDLDLSTQAKLLRVLETGEYQKVGAEQMKKTEIRVLCATHKNLDKMVDEGAFRKDLYFRLKGVTVILPPLRERPEDISVLIEKTASSYTHAHGIAPKYFETDAIDIMIDFKWPGNVRQLIDTIESLLVLAESDIISAAEVREYLGIRASNNGKSEDGLTIRVRQYEKLQIINMLHKTCYNISAAARSLKLDRTNLKRKITLHGIEILRPNRKPV
ncbi:MAG: sigma-54-dependent Fis family transcriptional regulator [candidate division Zixibacteria bacterium]|nr:sigma-54-dependent Fis family transcriptional regulator [candidate division Zixibacteria bacterium]